MKIVIDEGQRKAQRKLLDHNNKSKSPEERDRAYRK